MRLTFVYVRGNAGLEDPLESSFPIATGAGGGGGRQGVDNPDSPALVKRKIVQEGMLGYGKFTVVGRDFGTMAIHAVGQWLSSFPNVECGTLGALELVDDILGNT